MSLAVARHFKLIPILLIAVVIVGIEIAQMTCQGLSSANLHCIIECIILFGVISNIVICLNIFKGIIAVMVPSVDSYIIGSWCQIVYCQRFFFFTHVDVFVASCTSTSIYLAVNTVIVIELQILNFQCTIAFDGKLSLTVVSDSEFVPIFLVAVIIVGVEIAQMPRFRLTIANSHGLVKGIVIFSIVISTNFSKLIIKLISTVVVPAVNPHIIGTSSQVSYR